MGGGVGVGDGLGLGVGVGALSVRDNVGLDHEVFRPPPLRTRRMAVPFTVRSRTPVWVLLPEKGMVAPLASLIRPSTAPQARPVPPGHLHSAGGAVVGAGIGFCRRLRESQRCAGEEKGGDAQVNDDSVHRPFMSRKWPRRQSRRSFTLNEKDFMEQALGTSASTLASAEAGGFLETLNVQRSTSSVSTSNQGGPHGSSANVEWSPRAAVRHGRSPR